VPIYVAGSAVVVEGSVTHTASAPMGIVGFLPPEQLSHLRTGQHVFVRLSPTGERLSSSITVIDPAIISPAVAQQRFMLSAGAAQAVTQPAGVVFVSPVPLPAGVPPDRWIGSVGQIEIEVESRRVISLIPLIGPLLEAR
jgi:hypothetical protein